MKKNRILSMLLIICVALSGNAGTQYVTASATTKASKAKKAYVKPLTDTNGIFYKNHLYTSVSDCEFILLDINKDGIPELIFTQDSGYHVEIFAYVDGKVKSVGRGFAGTQEYYPNKKIYHSTTAHGNYNEEYYKFNGKKMKELAHIEGTDIVEETYVYYIGKKKVSKAKFESYVKTLLKGAKKKEPTWHKNTKKNRNKYLK
jgi:hypothetical protein